MREDRSELPVGPFPPFDIGKGSANVPSAWRSPVRSTSAPSPPRAPLRRDAPPVAKCPSRTTIRLGVGPNPRLSPIVGIPIGRSGISRPRTGPTTVTFYRQRGPKCHKGRPSRLPRGLSRGAIIGAFFNHAAPKCHKGWPSRLPRRLSDGPRGGPIAYPRGGRRADRRHMFQPRCSQMPQ